MITSDPTHLKPFTTNHHCSKLDPSYLLMYVKCSQTFFLSGKRRTDLRK